MIFTSSEAKTRNFLLSRVHRQELSCSKSKLTPPAHLPQGEVDRFKPNNLYICELSDTLPSEKINTTRSGVNAGQQRTCTEAPCGDLKETLYRKLCATFERCRNAAQFIWGCESITHTRAHARTHARLPLSTYNHVKLSLRRALQCGSTMLLSGSHFLVHINNNKHCLVKKSVAVERLFGLWKDL